MQQTLLIIPCFNEGARLDSSAFAEFLASQDHADLCFVNDGSSDGTQQLLDYFVSQHSSRASAIHLSSNVGKAAAVRAGILASMKDTKYSFIGYWDADLSTPLNEVESFLSAIQSQTQKTYAIFGSRHKRLGAKVNRSAMRHIVGRVFATFASMILQLPVYDSQCGSKLFRREVIDVAFADPFMSRWLFDVEILARFRNQFGKASVTEQVTELPLGQWEDKTGSKVSLWSGIRVPFELIKIGMKYHS
jgi:glycosyltransferase involved in cell wall biosynthesis